MIIMDDAIYRGKAYSDAYNNTIVIYPSWQ